MTSALSVLDIPPEITSTIFLHSVQSLESYGPEDTLPRLSPYEPPLLFGTICRQWRSVALSTPELWDSIQVDCPYLIEDVVPAVERWLLRSGSLPLSIGIRYQVHPDTSSDDLLRLLRRHSAQLQNLTLTIPAYDLYRFPEIVGPLPSLKKLVVTCLTLRAYGAQRLSAFGFAPELRDIRFTTSFSPSSMALPWEQLTTFRADTLRSSQALHVLSLSSALVNCRFDLYEDTKPLTPLPLHLHLKSFILRGTVTSTDLLAQLTTPALTHLEVQGVDLDLWCAFLARSGCTLKHLSIETTGWTSAMFIQGLNSLSSLTELEVWRPGPSVYHLIRLLNTLPRFLPHLRVFDEDPGFRDYPPLRDAADLGQSLIEMLEKRWHSNGNARLERFSLYETDQLVGSPDLLRRLQALVENGMKVHISGSESWDATV
ncbi:hypothetical protein DFH07DRAFT_890660 [Mycena maculata]|uniref:F-box domain-containing protein n=1 Tax=Mycena maculata TaxID=230809 RepID=A0AAD7N4E7_9AGAR|nr:hypothetical protein DFH07DRAFT_890660 [Mycena maculata]